MNYIHCPACCRLVPAIYNYCERCGSSFEKVADFSIDSIKEENLNLIFSNKDVLTSINNSDIVTTEENTSDYNLGGINQNENVNNDNVNYNSDFFDQTKESLSDESNKTYTNKDFSESGIKKNKYIKVAAIIGVIVIIATVLIVYNTRFDIKYFNLQGANNPNVISYSRADGDILFKDLKKKGYKFDGWYEDDSFTRKVKGIKTGSWGEVIVFAKWTEIEYKINYQLNGGVNSGLNPKFYTINSSFSLANPTKSGYIFSGWYDSNNRHVLSISKGTTGDLSLNAWWTAETYNIYYYDVFDAINNNQTTYRFGETISLSSLKRNGYEFDGWYKDSNYTQRIYDLRNEKGDVYLYAKWKPIQYRISYYLSGGINNYNNPNSYNIEDSFNLYDPERPGFRFLYWTMNGAIVNHIQYGTTGYLTLQANWERIED